MKVLFDQGVPVPLRDHLDEYDVSTAFESGWSSLKNGDLLDAAEADEFDVLVTTDQSLRHQQNLDERTIAIIVLLSTAWPRIQSRVDEIIDALDAVRPGDVTEIVI